MTTRNAFVALALLLASPAVALRRQSERNYVHVGRHTVNSSSSKELRVFSTSFNTGNAVYDNSQGMHDLTKLLVNGHEEPGLESDIIFLGFQEFSDDKYGLGNMAREGKLWRNLAKTSMEAFKAQLEEAATPPADVHEAKAALAKDVQAFHRQIGSKFASFRETYGEDGQDFHEHLAEASAVNVLSRKAAEVTAEVSEAIKKRLQEYSDEAAKAPKLQFENMTNAASALSAWGDNFPTEAVVKEKMAPIHTWTEGALNKIEDLKRRYPNLAYTSTGESLWKAYEASIDNSKQVEQKLLSKTDHQRDEFRKALADFQNGVKSEAQAKEKAISDKLSADWNRINDAIKTLSKDLDTYTGDGKTAESIAEGAKGGAKKHADAMHKALSSWDKESGDLVHSLLQPKPFGVKHDHVEVHLQPQKYDSGWRCSAGKHYDTILYAYVNPFSKWKITPETFNNAKCVERTAGSQMNPGCNIDNNQGIECGKVVNLMVLKAEQGDTSLKICGLNTHMSFAGKAEERTKFIKEAMDQTELAKCDSVFFMGDFNSRVHCEVGSAQDLRIAQQNQKKPPYEREGNSGRSMDYILDEFCKGQKCELKDSNLDELNQILSQREMWCYEKFSKPKPDSWFGETIEYWGLEPQQNPVAALGLREAAEPNFLPTYKVKKQSKIKPDAWKRCFNGEPTCFMNDSKKGKHNPAWTDRILMKSASESIQLETTEYSRRAPSADFGSDHVAVIAKVTVKIEA